MTQDTQPQTYQATDLYVPVQRLQAVPQLAKASAPAPQSSSSAAGWLTPGFMITSLGLAAMAALGTWTLTDGLYGGADVRAMRAQLEQLQQQNAELQQLQQQQRDAIAQAIGCQPGEGY